jgi:DNA helicase-2/ATP-dependent DNA helicase PcrA
VSVEGSYSVTLAGHLFEGRIDAVFHDGDDPLTGWTVVDWKTGRRPDRPGPGRTRPCSWPSTGSPGRKLLSSARHGRHGRPGGRAVRACFHYVLSNETWEPGTLPSAEDLAGLAGRTGRTARGCVTGSATVSAPTSEVDALPPHALLKVVSIPEAGPGQPLVADHRAA